MREVQDSVSSVDKDANFEESKLVRREIQRGGDVAFFTAFPRYMESYLKEMLPLVENEQTICRIAQQMCLPFNNSVFNDFDQYYAGTYSATSNSTEISEEEKVFLLSVLEMVRVINQVIIFEGNEVEDDSADIISDNGRDILSHFVDFYEKELPVKDQSDVAKGIMRGACNFYQLIEKMCKISCENSRPSTAVQNPTVTPTVVGVGMEMLD